MLNQILKTKFQPYAPLNFFKFLYRLKITPNVLTCVSIVFGGIAFYFFLQGKLFLGGIFVFLNYLFDILDGAQARILNLTTKFGLFFDFLSDRIVRFGWYLALVYSGIAPVDLIAKIILLEAISNILFLIVSWQNLKHINWMPYVFILFPFGAILNLVSLALTIELYIGGLIFLFNFITILYLNYSNKLKSL